MRYLSLCAGIEAASCAWSPLGWEPVAYSEIDKFASAALAQRHPGVPNWGDMTKFQEWPDAAIDVLVGGTPCQAFSVAGLRKGLADPRGNLMLTYLAIAAKYRPTWLVWENVPGVLSSNGGRDFGSFLGGLGELGYGFAYRVLDAQYVRVESHPRAVPQRRRRVFVVGHSGGRWQRAASVLFERESLRGHPPPRRTAGQGTTARTLRGTDGGVDREDSNTLIHEVCGTLSDGAHYGGGSNGQDAYAKRLIPVAFGGNNFSGAIDVSTALRAKGGSGHGDLESETFVVGFHGAQDPDISGDVSHPVARNQGQETCVAFTKSLRVRRLTPLECERLQGFPDGHTLVEYRGKPAADGPRYKALGNSMAVNVMRWIGERIDSVHAIPLHDIHLEAAE